MHIGLLEDDIAIQEMLLLVLQDEGHTVRKYLNADECFGDLGASSDMGNLPIPIDLLIVDWRLSGSISGTEVIQQLRDNPRFHRLPIILTTAATFNDPAALQHLHVSLLEKPFSVDEMLALIKLLASPLSSP